MKNAHLVFAALLVAALAIGLALSIQPKPSGNETPIDVNEAPNNESNNPSDPSKPIYYYFYSDTCPSCRAMDESTLSNATVLKALESNFNYVRVNTAKNRNLANNYRIIFVPTNVFIFPDGTEIGRVVGAILKPETFLKMLDEVLEFYRQNA